MAVCYHYYPQSNYPDREPEPIGSPESIGIYMSNVECYCNMFTRRLSDWRYQELIAEGWDGSNVGHVIGEGNCAYNG